MRPSMFVALVLLLATAATVQGQPGPIVSAIGGLTTASANLRITFEGITVVNAIFRGPQAAQGLASIGSAAASATTSLGSSGMEPLDDAGATQVVAALRTFVRVHQDLLAVVIGKKGLLSTFGFTEPVRVALVELEKIVDALAFAIIDLIPTKESEGNMARQELSLSLKQSVTAYEDGGLLGLPVNLPISLGK